MPSTAHTAELRLRLQMRAMPGQPSDPAQSQTSAEPSTLKLPLRQLCDCLRLCRRDGPGRAGPPARPAVPAQREHRSSPAPAAGQARACSRLLPQAPAPAAPSYWPSLAQLPGSAAQLQAGLGLGLAVTLGTGPGQPLIALQPGQACRCRAQDRATPPASDPAGSGRRRAAARPTASECGAARQRQARPAPAGRPEGRTQAEEHRAAAAARGVARTLHAAGSHRHSTLTAPGAQLMAILGSCQQLAGMHSVARRLDRLAAEAEASLQQALRPPQTGHKRLRLSLSHAHTGQHGAGTALALPAQAATGCVALTQAPACAGEPAAWSLRVSGRLLDVAQPLRASQQLGRLSHAVERVHVQLAEAQFPGPDGRASWEAARHDGRAADCFELRRAPGAQSPGQPPVRLPGGRLRPRELLADDGVPRTCRPRSRSGRGTPRRSTAWRRRWRACSSARRTRARACCSACGVTQTRAASWCARPALVGLLAGSLLVQALGALAHPGLPAVRQRGRPGAPGCGPEGHHGRQP